MRSLIDFLMASRWSRWIFGLGICMALLSCKSGQAPKDSAGETAPGGAKTAPAPQEAAQPGALSAVQPAGAAEVAKERPPAGSPAPAGTIPPSTKRTATGLPDTIQGYPSWSRLGEGPQLPDEAKSVHLPVRQAYLLLSYGTKLAEDRTPRLPLKEETTVALESKSADKDFIEAVSVMTKSKDGWKYLQYGRASSDAAFAPASTDSCAGCHAKADRTDGVYSKLMPQ